MLRCLGYKHNDFFITTSSALVIGISIFLLLLYIFSWFSFQSGILIYVCLFSFLEIKIKLSKKNKKLKFKSIISFESIILFVGSLAMASIMWTSGVQTEKGLVFYEVNATDGFYHLSLIGSLMHHFPPLHAGLADVPLRGYHFFYDLLLAFFANTFHFNKLDLYFRLFPFFIAFFYGIAGLSLARFLRLPTLTTALFLFLLYFGQGFGFILNHFFLGSYETAIIQSLAHIVDPNVIFSTAIIFSFFTLLFSSRTILQFVFAGIVLGVVPDVKIYAAVVLYGALFFVSIAAYIKQKDIKFFITLITACFVGAIVYLPLNYGAGQLIFAPFLFYRHFMEGSSMFADFQWALKYQTYEAHHNYLRIVYLYAIAMLFYFIPSLGFRLLSLAYIPKLFKRQFYTLEHIFWLTGIAITFIIPTFFIQSIAVFVTVQFFWYGYLMLLLPTAVMLGKAFSKTTIPVIVVLFGLLILASTSDTLEIFGKYTNDQYLVSKDIVQTAAYIEKNIPLEKGILVISREKSGEEFKDREFMPLISALSNHAVYYEPELLEFTSSESINNERKKAVDEILMTLLICENKSLANQKVFEIMKKTKNEFILILETNTCIDSLENFKKVYKKGKNTLYKLI